MAAGADEPMHFEDHGMHFEDHGAEQHATSGGEQHATPAGSGGMPEFDEGLPNTESLNKSQRCLLLALIVTSKPDLVEGKPRASSKTSISVVGQHADIISPELQCAGRCGTLQRCSRPWRACGVGARWTPGRRWL